ncbi:Delta and Notch-like epidermal growth factor-related receptor [Trichinella zimbabwensis]|uniref:Delta and Notch-like epidermal growth factor-related receptor n=1 Tax=Trichinella zimbabwensis TaxID=268475 RepID=A0A0V1H8A5_9BILA|nr:Delta and Notch-like epidermal growth factor-related receptor [Trichinella zimbabwensis]
MIQVHMFCLKLVVLQYFIAFSTCVQLEDHNQCIGTFCYNGGTCLTPKGMKQSIFCDSEGFIRLPKKVVRYGCKCNRNFVGAFCNTTKHEAMCNLRADCQSKFMQITVKDNQCHCSCREGYTGSDCSVKLPCARIHCEHKAECVNGKCNCSGTLYTGKTCERINITLLKQLNAKNLCQDRDAPKCNRNINARCTLALNHEKKVIAYCNCTPPWTGNRECTKKFDACELTEFEKSCLQDYRACDLDAPVEESRCKNGGLCLSDAKSLKGQARKFLCKCEGNFVGPFCEFEDYCKYKNACPTEHHECRLTSDQDGLRLQKLCLCKPGYTGKNCERKLTDSQIMAKCINNKCSNTSVCIPCIRLRGICTTKEQHRRGYICACDPSQSGEFCEQHVSPCVTHECKNHGICKEVDEYTYKCICKPGITGLHCDVIDNMCETRTPCVHGICTVNKHIREGYKCECKHGYRGVQCELPAYILFGKWSTSRNVITMAYSAIIGLIVTICFLIYAMSQPEELSPDSESQDESMMKNSESGLAERTISRIVSYATSRTSMNQSWQSEMNCECATNLSGERCEMKESKVLNKEVIFPFTFAAVLMIALMASRVCICPPKNDDQTKPNQNNHNIVKFYKYLPKKT